MALKEQITEDMKTAMRAKDMERLGTIRLLLASIKQKEVDEQTTLDDNAVIAVLDKMLKQRKDSITAFEQGGRADLAAKEAAELVVLQAYLPARLSADEVAAEVQAIVAELGLGLLLLAGYRTRWAALALALFTVVVYVFAFIGDEQATPHFMRYSGLTGACINSMLFNNFIRQAIIGVPFIDRFRLYCFETNWNNGEVVLRGCGSNFGEEGFLRPGFLYSH